MEFVIIYKSLLTLLLIATFFKQLLWVGVVPLWHFPDEPNHFAQVQNCVERGECVGGDLSDEVIRSEKLLQVFRDEKGQNAFVFHPEFNIPYSDEINGLKEAELRQLAIEYTGLPSFHKATSYPPLYYWLSGWWYRLMGSQSIIERVFIIRIFSVILFTATVWLAVLIGRMVFTTPADTRLPLLKKEGSRESMALLLGILVAFQPMFSFVGASVNSDVLFNFWFTLFIYGGVKILAKSEGETAVVGSKKFSIFNFQFSNITNPTSYSLLPTPHSGWIIVLVSLVGGFLTKQQMAIAVFMLPVLFLPYLNTVWSLLKTKKGFFSILFLSAILWGVWQVREGHRILAYIKMGKQVYPVSLVEHIRWTLLHTYREVLPWYWGVFKWLGVVLPRWVLRVQMALLALSGIGICLYGLKVWNQVKSQKLKVKSGRIQVKSQENGVNEIRKKLFTFYLLLFTFVKTQEGLLFILWSVIIYFATITLWDWRFRISHGFSFGVQGRYFLPVIVPSMILILIGLQSLWHSIWYLVFSIWGHMKLKVKSGRIQVKSQKKGVSEIRNKLFTFYFLLFTWFLVFHFIALYVVVNSYYEMTTWSSFVAQASQYKPLFFKGYWWVVWGGMAGVFIISLYLKLLPQFRSVYKNVK